MKEWLRRPRRRLRNANESEFKRRLNRRQTRGMDGREEVGRRERHSKRRSSGKSEIMVAGIAAAAMALGVGMRRRGEGVVKWRWGSEGMQGFTSHDRLREWQLSAMAGERKREKASSPVGTEKPKLKRCINYYKIKRGIVWRHSDRLDPRVFQGNGLIVLSDSPRHIQIFSFFFNVWDIITTSIDTIHIK